MLVHHAQAPESESEQVSQSRFTNASPLRVSCKRGRLNGGVAGSRVL